jgi:hypothetical protein
VACNTTIMAEPGRYRVIVQSREKPASGYTYLITRIDIPDWSQGTHIHYPSPESAGEAGWVALESLLIRSAARQQ